MARKRLAFAAVTLAMATAACAGGGSAGDAADTGSAGGGVTAGPQALRERPLTDEAVGAIGSAALPPLGPTVIKTAELEVEVARERLDEAVSQVTAVADAAGGFLLSSTTAPGGSRTATVVIRVPSERFEESLRHLRTLGTVESEHVAGEEVGQEFVDLEARLRNFQAQQTVLLRLMNDAVTITDTIRVQNELQGVQLEMERIKGRLRYLRDQTALGTITVRLKEEGAAATSVFGSAWNRAVDLFLGLISALIVAGGVVVPIGLMAVAALIAYRRLRPRVASS